MKMKSLLVVGTAMILTANVWAQGPGGGGGRRNNPKFRLTGLMRSIGRLERNPKAKLTPAQAQRIVSAVTPWQKKSRMSEAEAKTLYMQINSVLTTNQKNELDKDAAKNRRFGGGRGDGDRPGGDRPRGGGMGMGGLGGGLGGNNGPSDAERQKMRQQMQAMRGFMQTVNPFYPPSNYPEVKKAPERMQEGMKRRYENQKKLIAALTAKARGAKKAHR